VRRGRTSILFSSHPSLSALNTIFFNPPLRAQPVLVDDGVALRLSGEGHFFETLFFSVSAFRWSFRPHLDTPALHPGLDPVSGEPAMAGASSHRGETFPLLVSRWVLFST